jgi:predicted acylesterase/phospholipase RssA
MRGGFMGKTVRIAVLGLTLALGACATRPQSDIAPGHSAPFGIVAIFDKNGHPMLTNDRALDDGVRDVLVISGGGSHGAFGAGVLAGWTQSGRRPTFDIVTGISTGALMAGYAFLGPAYDAELQALYTQTHDRDIYLVKGIAGLFGQSVFDANPLRKKIDEAVNPEFLAAIAREHAKGRRLYVGTSNLDDGQVAIWNMGEIAASDRPDKRELFRDILLASAAIPGLFEPVFLPKSRDDGGLAKAMHVDGGVRSPLLLRSFMLIARGPRTVHVLVNSTMSLRDQKLVSPNLLPIAQKSITEMLRGMLYKTAYQAYVTSRNAGANFRFIAIPDDRTPTIEAINFEPEGMKAIFDTGYSMGLGGQWAQEIPRLEAFERVGRR